MMDTHIVRQAKPSSGLTTNSVEVAAYQMPAASCARRLAALVAVFAIASWLTLLWLPGVSPTAADATNTPCASQVACAESGLALPSIATVERWRGASDRSAERDQEPDASLSFDPAHICRPTIAARSDLRRAPRFSEVISPNNRGPPA